MASLLPAKGEEPFFSFPVDGEQRAEEVVMYPQDHPKKRGLQQGIPFHPDDPSRIFFRIQLDHLDHITEQAPGVFLIEEVRIEAFGELPLFDMEVIDARSQEDELQLDKDGAAVSRPELEQAEVGEGVQGGVWLS